MEFPGIEDRVNLMYTYGVKRGRLDIHRFVDAAEHASRRNCLGCFRARERSPSASDADLVVYDPDYRGTISAKTSTRTMTTTDLKDW